jgi:hypothetical protein
MSSNPTAPPSRRIIEGEVVARHSERRRSARSPWLPRLAGGLFAVWLAAMAYAFWYVQGRFVQPFYPEFVNEVWDADPSGFGAAFAALVRDADAAAPGRATVYHFWDPDCPCTRFNTPHVRELVEQYSASGVEFVVVPAPGVRYDTAAIETRFGAGVRALDASLITQVAVPSSPAAVLVSSDRDIAYFGPYSSGAFCGGENGRYVEDALERSLAGNPAAPLDVFAAGCYCDWQVGSAADSLATLEQPT